MPDFWTHLIHGSRTARELDYIFENDEDRAFYNLGTQGPDVFLYVVDDHHYMAAGKRIHNQKCGMYLNELSRSLYRNYPAFVHGLVCHHTLDRMVHPYVISRAGNSEKHTELETAIDYEMVRRFLEKDPLELDPLKELPEEIPDEIEKVHLELIYRLYKIDKISMSRSLSEMRNVMRQSRRVTGLRKTVTDVFGIFKARKTTSGSAQPPTDFPDVLNLSKKPWYHPTTGWVSRATVLDLLEEATEVAKDSIDHSLQHDVHPEMPDLSFMNNLPCVDY